MSAKKLSVGSDADPSHNVTLISESHPFDANTGTGNRKTAAIRSWDNRRTSVSKEEDSDQVSSSTDAESATRFHDLK